MDLKSFREDKLKMSQAEFSTLIGEEQTSLSEKIAENHHSKYLKKSPKRRELILTHFSVIRSLCQNRLR
jgi:hypothetical protein